MLFDPHSTDEDTRLDFDQLVRRVNIPSTILEDVSNIFAYTQALGKTRNKKFKQVKTLRGVYLNPRSRFKSLLYIREVLYPSSIGILWIYTNIAISFILQILVQTVGRPQSLFWGPLVIHALPPIGILWFCLLIRMILLAVYFNITETMLYDVLVEICDRPLVLASWAGLLMGYEFLLPFESVACIMQGPTDDTETETRSSRANSNAWSSEVPMRTLFSKLASSSSSKSIEEESSWPEDGIRNIYLSDFENAKTGSSRLIDHMKCTHIYVDPRLPLTITKQFLSDNEGMIRSVNEKDRNRWKTGSTDFGIKFVIDSDWADDKAWIYNNPFVEERVNYYQANYGPVFRQMLVQPRTILPMDDTIIFRLWIVLTFAWYLKTFLKEIFVYKFRVKIMMPIKNQIIGYLELLTLLNGFTSKLSIEAESMIVSQKGHFANRTWYGTEIINDFPVNPYSWEDKYKRSTRSGSSYKEFTSKLGSKLAKRCLLIPKDVKASDYILHKARNLDTNSESMVLCLAEFIRRNPSRKIEVEVLDEDGIRESHFELGLQNLTESLVVGAIIYKTFCFVHYNNRVHDKAGISSIIHSPSDAGSLPSRTTDVKQEAEVETILDYKRTGELRDAVLADLNRVIKKEEKKGIKNIITTMSSGISSPSDGGKYIKKFTYSYQDDGPNEGSLPVPTIPNGFNVTFDDVGMHKASLPDSINKGVSSAKSVEKKRMGTNEKVKRCVEWLILLHSRRYKEHVSSQYPTFKRNLIRKYLTPHEQIIFRYKSLSGSEMFWDIHANSFMKIFEDLNDERIKILSYLQNQEKMYHIYSRIITAFGTIIIIFFLMIGLGISIGTVILSGVAVLAAMATFLSVVYKDYAESVLLTCVINPYSVGERITLGLTNGITVVVDKINTFYSTFLTDEGKSLVIPHSQVSNTAIQNLSRSSMSTQMIFFLLDAETSDIRWRALEELLYQYTMTRPEYIIPDSFAVLLVNFQPGHFLEFECYYCCPISWDKIFIQYKIKEDFLMYMREMCQALNVSYKLPTQRLQASSKDGVNMFKH